MRLPALIAAFTLSAVSPIVAMAQTPSPADRLGVTPTDARDWLIGLGGGVREPIIDGNRQTLQVADEIPWSLILFDCSDVCGTVQFGSLFHAQAMTLEQVNDWNISKRFASAVFVPATETLPPRVLLTYDVILTGTGAEQLREPTVVWLKLRDDFNSVIPAE